MRKSLRPSRLAITARRSAADHSWRASPSTCSIVSAIRRYLPRRENGAWFGSQLREIGRRTGRIRDVRGVGYMWGVDVMGTAAHVVSEAQAVGLLVCSAGEYTVRLLPPLVATRDDLTRGLALLEQVL